jgi:putative Mg2+ transporter-C (MgtC) family protein
MRRTASRWNGCRITYVAGMGLLCELVNTCTDAGFVVSELATLTPRPAVQVAPLGGAAEELAGDRTVEIVLSVRGRGDRGELGRRLTGTPGVLACAREDFAEF